jgi:PIN domain nuclease of toxin-antitoxin system
VTVVVLDPGAALLALAAELPRLDASAALVSAVTLAELLHRGLVAGKSVAATEDLLREAGLRVVPFDERQAAIVAEVTPYCERAGITFPEAACVALAIARNATLLTTGTRLFDTGLVLAVERVG